MLEETLSAFVEQRCKRFDDGEPLASRRSARVEPPSALEETLTSLVGRRCKRFNDGEPLASPPLSRRERLQAFEETLTSFAEHRCKGLGDGGPLAAPPFYVGALRQAVVGLTARTVAGASPSLRR